MNTHILVPAVMILALTLILRDDVVDAVGVVYGIMILKKSEAVHVWNILNETEEVISAKFSSIIAINGGGGILPFASSLMVLF